MTQSAQSYQNFQFYLKRTTSELWSLALFFMAGFILITLLGYYPSDAGWSNSGVMNQATQHIFGKTGAYVADSLLSLLGFAAYWLPVGMVHLGWQIIRSPSGMEGELLLFRLGALVVSTIIIACMFALHIDYPINSIAQTGGGFIGQIVDIALLHSFSPSHMMILYLILFFLSATILFNIKWLDMCYQIGRIIAGGAFKLLKPNASDEEISQFSENTSIQAKQRLSADQIYLSQLSQQQAQQSALGENNPPLPEPTTPKPEMPPLLPFSWQREPEPAAAPASVATATSVTASSSLVASADDDDEPLGFFAPKDFHAPSATSTFSPSWKDEEYLPPIPAATFPVDMPPVPESAWVTTPVAAVAPIATPRVVEEPIFTPPPFVAETSFTPAAHTPLSALETPAAPAAPVMPVAETPVAPVVETAQQSALVAEISTPPVAEATPAAPVMPVAETTAAPVAETAQQSALVAEISTPPVAEATPAETVAPAVTEAEPLVAPRVVVDDEHEPVIEIPANSSVRIKVKPMGRIKVPAAPMAFTPIEVAPRAPTLNAPTAPMPTPPTPPSALVTETKPAAPVVTPTEPAAAPVMTAPVAPIAPAVETPPSALVVETKPAVPVVTPTEPAAAPVMTAPVAPIAPAVPVEPAAAPVNSVITVDVVASSVIDRVELETLSDPSFWNEIEHALEPTTPPIMPVAPVTPIAPVMTAPVAPVVATPAPQSALVEAVAPIAPVAPIEPVTAPVVETVAPVAPIAPVVATPAPQSALVVETVAPVTPVTPVEPVAAPVVETVAPTAPVAPVVATPAPQSALVVETVAPITPAVPIKTAPPVVPRAYPDEYLLPSMHLFKLDTTLQTGYSDEELDEMANLLEHALRSYRIQASVANIEQGPVVTSFEIDPAAGTKGSQISNLDRDLARSLSVPSLRVVEVVPGKPYIGLEIPNKNRSTVHFRTILESPAYQAQTSPLTMVLGCDIAGEPVVSNLGAMPHLLVAGTTGSGKSVGINVMLASMLCKAKPDELKLILIDPKMLEMSMYEDIPHLITPVVTDMNDAENALKWAVSEMERRYQLMSGLKVRKIDEFNQIIKDAQARGEVVYDPNWDSSQFIGIAQQPPVLKTLPYIVIVIDELADMMMVVGKKVEELIARIAQKARAAGIHLILATQRPSVDVLTGLIKANVPSRIAFQVSSKIDSRTILDAQGAESLLGHGDMLFAPSGKPTMRVHGAFISDKEVDALTKYLRTQGEPEYEEAITQPVAAASMGAFGANEVDSEKDELFDQAVHEVLASGKSSISYVQRKLSIGYNRAAKLIETMERAGILSRANERGVRHILVERNPFDD